MLSGMGFPRNFGYYTAKRSKLSDNVKFYGQQKFLKRVMIWSVISPKGLVLTTFETGNMEHNRFKETLKKFLLPFLKKENKSRQHFIFWPDLAPCHYHKDVIKFLNENKVLFVQKLENPPNCPEIRPVEKFWAH